MGKRNLDIIEGGSGVFVMRDVKVPERFYQRISFGVKVLDEIFGGSDLPGVVGGSSYLFTGDPGAGKSTMCLQLADLLQRNAGRSVLYNNLEENLSMVKMRADRLGLANGFATGQIADVNELVRYCKANAVEVLMQDSIQTLTDGDLGGHALLKSVVHKMVKLCSTGVTAYLIGHITKGGQFSGPQGIKHAVDGHVHMKVNKANGRRIFQLEKNRNGPAWVPYEFTLSAQGMDFHQLPQDQVEDAQGRSATRAQETKDLIVEKLKAGERISGYCFERFNVDCSGGYWRGMLAKAVKELAAQGYRMGTCRNGPSGANRNYDYVVAAPGEA